MTKLPILALAALTLLAVPVYAQSTATLSQTVAKRSTLGVVSATPASGLTADAPVTFSYTLHTAGAPAPTGETVQFMDGASALGSPQSITSTGATNLLPYSQISAANTWTTAGTVPTLTANSVNGPDGSTNTATAVAFPNTSSSGSSTVLLAVPGTAYAGQSMTLSVWAQSTASTTLTLALTDSPASAVSGSNTCAVASTWTRCSFTLAFGSGAGTGFAAKFVSTNLPAQTINLWGAQVEQASTPGPYVSTIGTARSTGAQGGSVSFPYSAFHSGTHVISVVYAGDTNFVASTSNSVSLTLAKATPTMTFAASPVSPSTYGTSIAFTATLSAPATNAADYPTGTVQLLDGSTPIGTATLGATGVATITLSGANSLGAGTHSLTIAYAGDGEFNALTSSVITYTVSKSSNITTAVSSSLNPSVYGDTVTLSVSVVSSAGAVPTGTVAITDSGTSLGTVTLNGTGAGTLTVPLFTAGTHSITVTYSGDANYN